MEQEKRKQDKRKPGKPSVRDIAALVTSGIVTALLFAGMTSFFLLPKKEFSDNENRALAKFPVFSWESLREGNFTEELQTYVNDHFPARDFFMALKTVYEKCSGKMQINGVYAAKDGYYIEQYAEPENTARIESSFRNFAEKLESAKATLMLVPTAVTIYADKLPAYAENADQLETIREICENVPCNVIDLSEALMAAKDRYPLYYRYDHHWTSYGAYIAYEQFCAARGFSCVPLEKMETETVSSDFKGTIYSKVNDYTVTGDEIVVMKQPEQRLTVIYDRDPEKTTDTLFNPAYLEKKDQYSFFLDNIHSYIEITNETAATEREIAVIKDSYANCFIPFLVNQYRRVYVYDTRYYRQSVSREINENPAITDVLILYNMNTIDHDLGIGGIY